MKKLEFSANRNAYRPFSLMNAMASFLDRMAVGDQEIIEKSVVHPITGKSYSPQVIRVSISKCSETSGKLFTTNIFDDRIIIYRLK